MSDYMTAMEKLEKMGLNNMAAELKKYYRNAIGCFTKEYSGDIPVGASKMGGFPDLPPNMEYPVMSGYTMKWLKGQNAGTTERYEESAMQLVAQINLFELAESEADIEKLLPERGILYIFWSGEISPLESDDWTEYTLDNPENKDYFKVIWWDGDMSKLKRTFPPCGYYTKYFEECLPERGIEFDSMDEYSQEAVDEIDDLEETLEMDSYDFSEGCDKLFGFPKGGNAPEVYEDTVNLFQFDYHDGCLWAAYWLMDKADLLSRDFSKVTFDCDID